jgi:hypothetical protein
MPHEGGITFRASFFNLNTLQSAFFGILRKSNEMLGLDEKNGLLVRMISTTKEAETTDSMNYPVPN